MKHSDRVPFLILAAGVLGVSLSAIFVRWANAPSELTAAWRLIWTVVLMTPVVLLNPALRSSLRAVPKKEGLLSMASGVVLAFHFYWWFESLKHTAVASSTVIVCTEVVWVALVYRFFMGGRLSPKAVLAIAVTLAGSIMVALSDSTAAGGSPIYGDFLSLIAAVAVAAYTLLGRQVRKTLSTTTYTYIVYLSCAVVLCLLCAANGLTPLSAPPRAIGVGLLLAVCCTLMGHSVFSWCLRYFSPAFVSASKLCEPVIAAAFALVLFGERPAPLQLLGGGVILAGVLYYSRVENSEQQAAKEG